MLLLGHYAHLSPAKCCFLPSSKHFEFPFLTAVLQLKMCILDSTGIGLIFTRLWEGTHPGWLMQSSRTNRIFDTMWCYAQYLSGGAGWGRVIAAWEGAGRQTLRKLRCVSFVLHILFIGIIAVSFLFSSILLNCLYTSPWVIAFSSDSPLLPTGREEWASDSTVPCCWLRLRHDKVILLYDLFLKMTITFWSEP